MELTTNIKNILKYLKYGVLEKSMDIYISKFLKFLRRVFSVHVCTHTHTEAHTVG